MPLLTLMGVKDGIISTLTARLIENPRNLEISPVGTGKFDQTFFQTIRENPYTAFIIPETRNIAATIQLSKDGFTSKWVSLSATGQGDPLLGRSEQLPGRSEQLPGRSEQLTGQSEQLTGQSEQLTGQKEQLPGQSEQLTVSTPESLEGPPQNMVGDIFVSQAVAEEFGLTVGEEIKGTVSRRREGRLEAASLELTVKNIVPHHVVSRDIIYCSLSLMEMTEDFRDGFSVPTLGWVGREKPVVPRHYASFRLYATDLDSVEKLRQTLTAQGLDVYTKAEEIAMVRDLEHSFTVVFLVLAVVVGAGALASASSSAMDQVAKMRRSLAMLRLLGLTSRHLLLFTILQAALTGLLAALVADGLFLGIASVLNNYFGASLGFGEKICWLAPWKLMVTPAISVIFMICASCAAAFSLSSIEPSEGMRDV